MKKSILFFIALSVLCTVFSGCADHNPDPETTVLPTLPAGIINENYNRLQTITVFGQSAPSGLDIPALEPLDGTSLMPSVMMESSVMSILLRDWAVTDLSLYVPNGYIQLEVKGEQGGENFDVGFNELKGGIEVTSTINTNGIIEVTADWTTVQIPISKISEKMGTDLSCARQFLIGNASAPIHIRNITIKSDDKEKVFPAFKVNQLGYKPNSEKRALVTGFNEILAVNEDDVFELVDCTNDKVVYTSELKLVCEYDEKYSGEKILLADFSEYNETGKYYLRMKNGKIEDSLPFEISDTVYDELLSNTMRYYYYQRANIEITENYGGKYIRQDMSEKDFAAPLSSDRELSLDVSGGWYDAGDIGKYVCPGATAVNTLLWTYKLFPEKFSDGQNNIPESGNGIPDILDEVKYELDFFLKMQDKDSGGFYLKVKSQSENDGDGDRTVWNGKGNECLTNATADCSATLAFASTIFRDFDKEYADTLLAAAEQGWEYITKNPFVYTKTTYSGNDDSSSVFWASACLYYATGNKDYEAYFLEKAEENYKFLQPGENGHSVGAMGIYGYFTYLLCKDKNAETVGLIENKFNSWKESVIKRYDDNPWNIAINEWSFWWGSFNIILGNAQDMYIGNYLLGLDSEENVTQDAVNFILGVNAMRKSYITGMGGDHIKCTFSNFYDGNSPDGVPSGYMPGGINSVNGGIISKFPIKCYIDDPGDWFTNENAIYWNAVMVFNTATIN